MIAIQLDLFDDVVRSPWGGRSPRGLTRAARSLIFKAGAAKKHERFVLDPQQYDLFDEGFIRPLYYRGAPTLLPLNRRIRE